MSLLASVHQPNLSNYYFALAGDPSLNNANWASFPAVTTINASGNAIDNATSIEIDGFVLTAGPNQLLLDGVPLVTSVDLSSIADWSLYESLSGGVDMAGYVIKNISGLNFLGGNLLRASGGKALVNGLDVVRVWSQCNALTSINAGGHSIVNVGSGLGTIQTGASDNILVNSIDVVSKWSDYTAESNVNMGGRAIQNANQVDCDVLTIDGQTITATPTDIFINGLPVGGEWSTLPAISDVSMDRNSIQDLSSIDFYYGPGASVILNASGGFLFANGNQLATGGAANQWSTFPAVSDVNMANRNIGSVRSLTQSNFIGSNAITSTGTIDFTGNVNFRSFNGGGASFSFDRTSSPSVITATSDIRFNGNSNILNGNCNVLGSSTYLMSNYLYGGTTIDGGVVRGCSIGCLPAPVFPYPNTQRIDVLPAGISVTSPTFITMNGLGAGNFAMGGALAFSAGSYMTLEHGFGLGSNGIYVQDTARDDAARMVFEFGGSVGNSIDTPTRAGNMDFHGTRMYMANMYATSRGGRYPRLPYLNIYDISQLNFYSGASILGNVSGSGNLTLSGNVAFGNAVFNGLTMNGNINMSGNAISNCTLLDMCAGIISNVQAVSTFTVDANSVTSFELTTSNIYLDPTGGGTTINVLAPTRFIQGVSGGGIATDSIGIVQTGRTVIDISGGFHFVNSTVSGSYITGGTGGTDISGGLAVTGNFSVTGSVPGLSLSGDLNLGGNSITNCSNISTTRISNLGFINSATGINVSAAIVDFLGVVSTDTLYVASNAELNTIIGTPTLSGVDLNFNGRTGTNVVSPISASNVANKDYVDKSNPVSFVENTIPVNIFTTSAAPVLVASGTIALPATSRIWVLSTTTYDHTGSGSADHIISSYLVINSVIYGTTRSSIPARFSPTIPSSTNVVLQQVVPTALAAGTYSFAVYAYANVSNADLTADHTDMTATAGLI